jgi:hypothetical protein
MQKPSVPPEIWQKTESLKSVSVLSYLKLIKEGISCRLLLVVEVIFTQRPNEDLSHHTKDTVPHCIWLKD